MTPPFNFVGAITHGACHRRPRQPPATVSVGPSTAMSKLPISGPQLTFHDDRDECHGFNGTYQHQGEVAIINICVTKRHTIPHELGHAWEAQAVTDKTRVEFMAYRGLTSWSDQDVEWDERGIEQAAVTIAMVLKWQSGSIDNPEFVERLCSYEILTGKPLPDSVPVGCEVRRPFGASAPVGHSGRCAIDP